MPRPPRSRKLFLYDFTSQFRIKIRGATEYINVNFVQFWVGVSTKVALRKHENSSGSVRLKLVKGSAHYCEPAPLSDLIHNSLKMRSFGDPYAFYMADEVLHLVTLGVANFICN
jgi:hypothetical protein